MKNYKMKSDRFIEKYLTSRNSGILIIILLFLFNTFLILSKITPGINQINPHDGAKYIESGHLLLTWGVRDLSWGPLVALIYAPLDLLVGHFPNWFLLEAWGGNLILFGLLWFGLVFLARNIREYISMPILIGLIFSLVVFFPILENQSDAFFLFWSMLSIAFLLRYRKNGQIIQLVVSSLAVGFGVLCRLETVLLIVPLFAFSLIFTKRRHKFWKIAVAVLLPFFMILGLYALVSYITIGNVDWGVGTKSIDSFNMNNAFLPGSKLEEAYRAGKSIIGPVEDYQNSILKIFIKNPMVFVERALANLLKMPASFGYFFGPIQGILIFALSLLGTITLVRKKDKGLLALLLIWPLHALVALLFLPRHVIAQMSFIFIILAAIGLTDLVFRAYQRKWLTRYLTLMGFVVIFAGVLQIKALFSASFIFLLVLLLKIVIEAKIFSSLNSSHWIYILLIGSLLVLAPGFEFPARVFGQTDVEQVVYTLQEALPERSLVLAPAPIVPIAARMVDVQLPDSVYEGNAFLAYLEDREIRAIYLDNDNPYQLDFIGQMIKQYPDNFELAYQSSDGALSLYLVSDSLEK